MRKLLIASTLATAAMSASLLTATAAHADTGWNVSPGGSVSGSDDPTVPVYAHDNTTGREVDCADDSSSANPNALTAAGRIPSGSNLEGNGLGSVTAVNFYNCTGPNNVGVTINVDASSTNPFPLNALSYDSANGITTGSLTNVSGSLDATDGCHATVSGPNGTKGTVSGNYTNSTGELTLGSGTNNNLVITSVNSSCNPQWLNVGDSITLSGAVIINPSQTISKS